MLLLPAGTKAFQCQRLHTLRANNQAAQQRCLKGRAQLIVRAQSEDIEVFEPKKDDGEEERLRLNNLRPQPGSRTKKTRKGRGYNAGKGGSCGRGQNGQKSRTGNSLRKMFEGGQTPLYKRLPKLHPRTGQLSAAFPKIRGDDGRMVQGQFVRADLGDIYHQFEENDMVCKETLNAIYVNVWERYRRYHKSKRLYPLMITLGRKIPFSPPDIFPFPVRIRCSAIEDEAKKMIEDAGGTVEFENPVWKPPRPFPQEEIDRIREEADQLFGPEKSDSPVSDSGEIVVPNAA